MKGVGITAIECDRENESSHLKGDWGGFKGMGLDVLDDQTSGNYIPVV